MRKVFSIYDSKVGSYLEPFFVKSTGEAERAIMDLVNKPDHHFNVHSADFTLFEIGSWDEDTGTFALLNAPHSVFGLHEVKKSV